MRLVRAMRICLAAVIAILLMPASAAVLLEDPPGDLRMEVYETYATAQPGDWEGLDLLFLNITEAPEDLFFKVGLVGLPDCTGGVCFDGPDIRTHFRYGQVGYYTQQGVSFDGFGVGRLMQVIEGQTNGRAIAVNLENTLDSDTDTMTLRVPRDLIVDESGNPLLRGRNITDIWTNTYGQFNFGGPSPDLQSDQDLFVQRDDMGIDAPASIVLRHGGFDGDGPLALQVESPFRASNGGAATYAYAIEVTNLGTQDEEAAVTVHDLPPGWRAEVQPGFELPLGATTTFPVVVHTPSGHQHGGTDRITVRFDASVGWTSAELGVHYVDVPQPAGHHPDLFLHARDLGTFGAFSEAFGGSAGDLWMNTLEEDADDNGIEVQGYNQGNGIMWTACLRPELRLGLDLNASKDGWMGVGIRTDLPQNIALAGRLLRLGPGEPILGCYNGRWDDRDVTQIATLATDPLALDASGAADVRMSVVPTAPGDYVRFEHGATLVLELTATLDRTIGPSRVFLQPGAQLHLPIDEYRDERPPGFIDGSAQTFQANATTTPTAPVGAKDSPLAVVWVLVPLAVVAARRR